MLTRIKQLITVILIMVSTHLVAGQVINGTAEIIKWNADGSKIAYVFSDGSVRIVDTNTQLVVMTIDWAEHQVSIDWHPIINNRLVVSSFYGPVRIWNVDSGELIVEVEESLYTNSVAYDKTGEKLITTHLDSDPINSSTSSKIKIRNSNTLELITESSFVDGVVIGTPEWSPDSSRIITIIGLHIDEGSRILVWNANNGQIIKVVNLINRFATDVKWNPNGTQFALAEGIVSLWDATTYQELDIRFTSGLNTYIGWFSPSLIIAGGNYTISTLDITTGSRTVLLETTDVQAISVNSAKNQIAYSIIGLNERVRERGMLDPAIRLISLEGSPIPTSTATFTPTNTPTNTATFTPTFTSTFTPTPAGGGGQIVFGGCYVQGQMEGPGGSTTTVNLPGVCVANSNNSNSVFAIADPLGGSFSDPAVGSGNRIAHTSDNQILIYDTDDQSLSGNISGTGLNGDVAWHPTDANRVAFASKASPTGKYVIKTLTLGGTPVAITTTASNSRNPSWTSDGRIVFQSDRDGDYEIYVMNADGTNVVQLTTNTFNDIDPNAAPDGKIVFSSNRDGNQEIYVMDAGGGNQRRVTTNAANDVEPNWSPDGNYIVFASNRTAPTATTTTTNYMIITMRESDGGQLTQIYTTALGSFRHPDWTYVTMPPAYVPPPCNPESCSYLIEPGTPEAPEE